MSATIVEPHRQPNGNTRTQPGGRTHRLHRPAPSPPRISRRIDPALALATTVGLLVRLAWWWLARPSPVADGLGYLRLAERLLETGDYTRWGEPTAWRPPLYVLWLAAGMLVSPSHRWLSLLELVPSTAIVPLTWLLASRLGLGERAAAAAAFAAALSPALLFWAPVVRVENLHAALLLAAFAAALHPHDTDSPKQTTKVRRAAIRSGVLFGLATLTRPETLVYLPVLPLLLRARHGPSQTSDTALTAPQHEPTTTAPHLTARAFLVTCAAALAVVAPWYLRNELVVGRGAGISTTGGLNFYIAHALDRHGYGWGAYEKAPPSAKLGEEHDEVAASRLGWRLGWQAIAADPGALARRIAHKTARLWEPPTYAPYFSTRGFDTEPPFRPSAPLRVRDLGFTYTRIAWPVLAAAALLGARTLRRTHPAALRALLGILAANWLCFAVVFWGIPRYRFAVEPILALAAGVALARAVELAWEFATRLTNRPGRSPRGLPAPPGGSHGRSPTRLSTGHAPGRGRRAARHPRPAPDGQRGSPSPR
ncbi:MAG: hypothetical protein KatS3mg008_1308 [Acidimicrobiales bacterium]|nr:MAG: hypothetical protein KatS3mg008_1308 [Acidimicrobiales bacterium]